MNFKKLYVKTEISNTKKYVLYALPVVTLAWLMAPLAVVQGIYAKHHGLSLTSIASVLVIARLFDAVTDPMVGYFSDCYQQRYGSRKPIMIVGGVLFTISAYFLYVPPVEVTVTVENTGNEAVTPGALSLIVDDGPTTGIFRSANSNPASNSPLPLHTSFPNRERIRFRRRSKWKTISRRTTPATTPPTSPTN